MSDTTNTRKYKGYELDQTTSHRRNQNRPWFWKVLGISLLLTVLILAGVVFGLLHRTHKNAKHMEEINSCLLYTSPSPRDMRRARMPSSA